MAVMHLRLIKYFALIVCVFMIVTACITLIRDDSMLSSGDYLALANLPLVTMDDVARLDPDVYKAANYSGNVLAESRHETEDGDTVVILYGRYFYDLTFGDAKTDRITPYIVYSIKPERPTPINKFLGRY